MPKDFRLTLWIFLLGLAVQTAYAETTKNVDPKNTQEAPETINTTSIVPPSNKASPTTNTTNTTTTTFAPTTTTSNTTMPIPTTTKIDVQSNCTEGLPLACWISPEFKALKSKRCECKNGTTFIYNATRCEHMTVYQKQEYLPGEFELALKCNYTLNECYQQFKLTTEKLSKKKKPNQPDETDVEDSLAGKGYAIAQAIFERNALRASTSSIDPFYFEDDECVYPVQGCTELLEEILFCDKNATVKKLGNFIEKDYSKEEDKYAAQVATHRKWNFVHVYVIIMAMLFGISICAIVVAALIYVLAFRKKKRFIKGKGAKTGRNISKSRPNKKEKNKKGAKLSPQDGSSMDVSIGQLHDVQPIKRRSTADNQTTGVESQTGTEPQTTAQIV
ncbi:unnamed protein product, partial [Mesorhabditis belari]|uniref:Uncharacterized protein n=1 Tax=Mesorhabditis belari TaxID=2138241 RepID=A0AAF3EWJ9_9BILA